MKPSLHGAKELSLPQPCANIITFPSIIARHVALKKTSLHEMDKKQTSGKH